MLPILNDSSLRFGPWSKGHTTRTLRSASALARLGLLAVYMPPRRQLTDGSSLFFSADFAKVGMAAAHIIYPTRDACHSTQDRTSSLLLAFLIGWAGLDSQNRVRQ
jgi:hypothetical protein